MKFVSKTLCSINALHSLMTRNLISGLGLILTIALAVPAGAAELQTVHSDVVAAAAGLPPVGRLPGTNLLGATIGLPLRNKETLTNLLEQLYDPASPQFRQYLSLEQFTEQFGPTEADYNALIGFAESHGLKVTEKHANRVVLGVSGTAAAFEAAFNVKMQVYSHPTESRTFYAPDVHPSLDTTVPVLSIGGLDTYVVPHALVHKMPPVTPNGKPVPDGGSGPGGSIFGKDYRKAYTPGTTLNGAGQTVGILEFDDGFFSLDIQAYEAAAGLPNVPLRSVLLDGATGAPGGANDEVSLDIEMAISMAPGLSAVVVYEGIFTDDILGRMATDIGTKQFSASWTYPIDTTSEQLFQEFAAQGQSFFNASGDGDAYVNGVRTPADNPNVTVVGGTTLTTTGNGSFQSETAWNWDNGTGTSGGISTTYALPSYQRNINMSSNHGSTTKRNLPDIAMAADNIWIYAEDGLSGSVGGTSAATPLWAGLTALMNQQAAIGGKPMVGFLNPALYALAKTSAYATTMHDVRTGNNFSSASPTNFPAVNGYDLCTGWGSPNGTNFFNAIVSPFPAAPTNVVATVGLRSAQVTLTWNAVPGTTNYNVKRALVSGATYPTIATTTNTIYVDSGLNNGTKYYYVVSGVNAAGQGSNSAPVSATPFLVVALTNVAAMPRLGSAIITWNNDPPATGQVFFGTDTNYGSATEFSSTLATNQTVLLTGLQPETLYYYQAVSTIGSNIGSFTGTFFTDPSIVMLSSNANYSGLWFTAASAPDKYSPAYRYVTTTLGSDTSEALFLPPFTTPGGYDVYLWYGSGSSHSTNAPVLISSDDGVTIDYVDETVGDGGWNLVAPNVHFGSQPGDFAILGNGTGELAKVVTSDAIMFAYNSGQDAPTDGSVPAWWANYYYGSSSISGSLPGANGYTLYTSYVMGLSPTNATSALSFNIQPRSSGFSAVFSPYLGNRTYQLVSSTNLTSPSWTAVPNATVTQSTNSQGVITIPAATDAQTFYRLSVQVSQ